MALRYCSKANFGQLGSAPKSLRHQETIALGVTDMGFLLFLLKYWFYAHYFYTESDRITKSPAATRGVVSKEYLEQIDCGRFFGPVYCLFQHDGNCLYMAR
jgi:hypothetical protein